ncbi:response regulator [Pseudomonas luteola]|uniref:response regulator n=1 Tax=Pseudomonas luteola TaxID=47886 RepID=UPI003890C96C
MIFQTAVIIAPDEPRAGNELSMLGAALQSQALDVRYCLDTDVSNGLIASDEPAVVILMPSLVKPAAVAKAVRAVWSQCELIFVRAPEQGDAFRKNLGLAPMLGSHWSIAELVPGTLALQAAQAASRARRRIKLRTTLDQANVSLSATRSVDDHEYRRLRAADYYLANFINAAQEAIIGVDVRLDVLYWSAGAEELFGLSADETVGRNIRALPFWAPVLDESVEQVMAGKKMHVIEYHCMVCDAEAVLEVMLSGVRDESGTLIGVSVTIRDVSALVAERLAHEEFGRVIRQERQHLQQLFEQAPGFVIVTQGPQHLVELANRAFYQLVGHRDIIGKPASEAFPRLKDQALLEWLDRVYSTKRPHTGRSMAVYVQRVPDAPAETRYIDFVFQPVIAENGLVSGIFFQGHDVTAQKLAQEELQRSRENLQMLVEERTRELERSQLALHQSQKLEAIGKLTGGVAHDFNNVLQIIEGNLELLRPALGNSSSGMAKLDAAVAAVSRGAKLSSQLLAFARRQPLKPVPTNLSRLLRSMDDLLRRALGESVQIETIIAGGLWTTMVDPNQLENVILNLAINARDAMQGNGRLTLELSNAMLDDHYAQSQADVAPGQYVMLAVSDTGSGMSPDVMEHAFEPFFTTKPEGQGTGLGLSMAYGFAKQSGGHIRIYSELGSGTTIKLYLPRTHEIEIASPAAVGGTVIGGDETILVVEDDLAVQATVIDLLSGLGYKVLRANDAQSALSILQSGLHIDLLFTDVVMPGPLRSPELARQAKQLLPDIAVLFTSGYTQNAIVHGGRLDPGVELLSKPYRLHDLARKIRQLLASHKPVRIDENVLVPAPIEKAVGTQQVLILDDQTDLLSMTCEMVEMLGYTAKGCETAEKALEVLGRLRFDILLADVNLPGMSGIDLAYEAVRQQPGLRVIFMSGEGTVSANIQSMSLPKPFNLQQLEEALGAS